MVVNFRGKDLNAAGVRVSGTKITATPDEINQALDGITADVTAANLSEVTGGAETDLHSHAASGGGSVLLATYTADGAQTAFPTVSRPTAKHHVRVFLRVPNIEIGALPVGATAVAKWLEADNGTMQQLFEDNGPATTETSVFFADVTPGVHMFTRGTSSGTAYATGPIDAVTIHLLDTTPDPPEAVAFPAGTVLEVWAE